MRHREQKKKVVGHVPYVCVWGWGKGHVPYWLADWNFALYKVIKTSYWRKPPYLLIHYT